MGVTEASSFAYHHPAIDFVSAPIVIPIPFSFGDNKSFGNKSFSDKNDTVSDALSEVDTSDIVDCTVQWESAREFRPDGPASSADRHIWVQCNYPGLSIREVDPNQVKPLVEGYKLGPGKGLSAIFAGWEKRFWLEHGNFLLYFKEATGETKSTGGIYLSGCSVDIITGNYRGRPNCIKIRPTVPRDIRRIGRNKEFNNFVISFSSSSVLAAVVKSIKVVATKEVLEAVLASPRARGHSLSPSSTSQH